MPQYFRLIVVVLVLLLPGVAGAVTNAECMAAYNTCAAGCSAKRKAATRRLCYVACMAELAACKARASR